MRLFDLFDANRDAVKNYQIRHALVAHPKTPLQTAIRFMKTLRQGGYQAPREVEVDSCSIG